MITTIITCVPSKNILCFFLNILSGKCALHFYCNYIYMMQILSPIFLQGDVVRITDDRKKAMKAQKSVGSEWNEDILDVRVYACIG